MTSSLQQPKNCTMLMRVVNVKASGLWQMVLIGRGADLFVKRKMEINFRCCVPFPSGYMLDGIGPRLPVHACGSKVEMLSWLIQTCHSCVWESEAGYQETAAPDRVGWGARSRHSIDV